MSPNAEERMRILTMLEENKLTAEQAALLLNSMEGRRQESSPREEPAGEEIPAASPSPAALEDAAVEPAASPASGKKMHWFRVQVTDMRSGKPKVHVRLPLSLVGWGLKLGSRYTDEFNGMDMNELMEALTSGQEGKLIEVMDEEDGEHVEIYVE
jgi:hypothetical protein